MAVWGTPTTREDDAERAVRSGLELLDAVTALGSATGVPLQARCGVLTGEAATSQGVDHQGMVTGDMVNTASRLQSAASPGWVLVGDSTYRAASRAIAFEPVGELALKGKQENVSTWRALRVVAERHGQNRMAIEPPFVGRTEELRMLKELLHGTGRDGKPRVISVTGIGGIGKSRLSWELQKYVDGLTEPDLLASRPLPVVRRRRHVLGARRDGADARRDRRDRPARAVAVEAGGCPGRSTSPTRPSGGGSNPGSRFCSGSTSARPGAGTSCLPPGAPSSSGSATEASSRWSSRTCSGRTPACSTSSSRCWSGRATVRSSSSRSLVRSSRTGGPPGERRAGTSPRFISSRCPTRPCASWWVACCRPWGRQPSRGLSNAPRACRSTPSR